MTARLGGSLRARITLASILAAALPLFASADTFTVTTDADSGTGSLREAVTLANGTPVADTIAFALTGLQTSIALSSALPDVTGNLTLDGPDADLTIRGPSNTTPLLRVASGETVIQDLTLDQGTVSIANGAKLSFDLAEDRGLARDIGDAGALEKRGPAKLTLTGNNSQTGGTSVAAGTLQGNVASLPGDIAISSGATLIFDQAADGTKTGVISGSGTLIKTGAGMLILGGANTFTGQTAVNQGMLQGSVDTLPGNFSIASGAVLSFVQVAAGTEAGSITGAGAVEKAGTGRLTLTGSNSYSGGTTVTAGMLAGSAESIPGDVSLAAGTSLILQQTGNATQAGNLSGAGSVTKLGAGTLTLSGSNTYSGGTTIDAGALRGNTSSLQGAIENNASLVFDQPADGSYAGMISGPGGLEKTGPGTLRFTQNQGYTGLTTISAGRLELAGSSLPGDVNVLGGGALAPRAASGFGTAATGSATFASGAALDVRVDEGGGADRLASSGAVTIQPGAGLELRPGSGSYAAPVSFDVLTASSVSGDFTLLPQFAFLDVDLANLGDRIRATVQASGATIGGLGETPNQRSVARTLEAVQPTASGDLAGVFDSLALLTSDEVPAVLDSLSGEVVSDFEHTRLALTRRLEQAIAARLSRLGADGEIPADRARLASPRARGERELPPVGLPRTGERGYGAWFDALGLLGDVEGEDGSADLDYWTGGAAIGLDHRLGPRVAVGGVFGYAYSDLELSGVPGDGESNSLLGALYGAYTDSRFHLAASSHVGFHEMETSRRIRLPGIDRTARADFDGHDYGASVAGAVRLFSGEVFQVEPTASFSWLKLERSSFTEDGAGSISLRIEDESIDSLLSGAGLRAHAYFELGDGLFFAPELFATWLHEFGDLEREIRARFTGASVDAPFQIVGAELPRDSALTGIRWVTGNSRGASAELAYSALWSEQQVEHFASLGFHLVW